MVFIKCSAEIYKMTSVWSPLLRFSDRFLQLVISSVSQDRYSRKPYQTSVKCSWNIRRFIMWLQIYCSKILHTLEVTDIALYFSAFNLFTFLNIDDMFACFQSSGAFPWLRKHCKISVQVPVHRSIIIFTSFAFIAYNSVALFDC